MSTETLSPHVLTRRHLLIGTSAAALSGPLAGAAFAAPIKPDARSALIVVDVQNCFTPGGSLAVKDGDAIIPLINKLAKGFQNVVLLPTSLQFLLQ